MARQPRKKSVRAATLADVGRAAGVSAMAASAVLNGARTSSRISPETRAKILAAAAKLKYRPNVAARALANRRMNTIGVAAVIHGGDLNLYFLEALNGIIEGCARHNQNTTVFTLHDWTKDVRKIGGFCDGRIDGLIMLGPTITKDDAAILPEHTPFAALHPNILAPNIVNIESDEERGAYDMVRHLISLGHRRIMHISGAKTMLGAKRRIDGYQRALKDSGVPLDADLLLEGDFTVLKGQTVMESWLTSHVGKPLPTAIFAANDATAIACIEVLAKRGLRVPSDVSVCGFDDSLAARTTVPQLTTVRQPLRLMGSRAVDLLLERIQQAHSPTHDLPKSAGSAIFATELAVRDSVAAPGAERLVPPAAKR
ncbi:HTH-type transcriptional regulator DegA [mine drainage metagenome]|uniref:HTH-type transcriptional regulator DegA n=1 Tax=mine drainage metagenome TaxID=410659 RepID=A0A1J5SP44_9ZZZZ